MTSQAACLALRKDSDNEDDSSKSTLTGSRLVGDDSSASSTMEYSTSHASSITIDGVSLSSSLFLGDAYFQTEPILPPEWSNAISYESRGRQFAKTLIQKSKRKKTGLLQRAVRAFRRRKHTPTATKEVIPCTTSEEEEFSDGEITFDNPTCDENPCWQDGTAWQGATPENKVSTKITLNHHDGSPPPRDLDEISDCTSDATASHAGNENQVEVFVASDASECSPTDDDSFTDMLRGESPIGMPSPRRHRDVFDQFFPDGLFIRTSAEDVVKKLKLGTAGEYALQRLNQATDAATKAFDPSRQDYSEQIPTLVTIAGYQVPDYKTYVRQAVNNFRRNVLEMSDDLYAILERRMAAKNQYVISKFRLLPFAVELYALERIMMAQSNYGVETASI